MGRLRRTMAARVSDQLTVTGVALVIAALVAALAGTPRVSVITLAVLGLAALVLPGVTVLRRKP